MKTDLKDFQEKAVQSLLRFVAAARRDVEHGNPQAVVLSSPTGSGKTVTITALMERVFDGHEGVPGKRGSVFLWMSDSPELNEQSRDRILEHTSVFKEAHLEVIDASFDHERFSPGRIYFLNTQKLGKNSLLTSKGDGRAHTIWDTIQATAQAAPSDFYFIIDEAHRGMQRSTAQANQADSLVQRFIFGWPEVGLEPVKLILGMSATPERFMKLTGASRTLHPCQIDPADVRKSGLLKDKIVLHFPTQSAATDWTLLEQATKQLKDFDGRWERYCTEQGMDAPVKPALVVQVENESGKDITRTDLAKLVSVLERGLGKFGDGEVVHCFQEDKTLDVGGCSIRKLDPSHVQKDQRARVVLFKMALTTGWDCPRAEVMMSFRKAVDHTLIAQLVGRMVRTPLARRIEQNDVLNTVALYLPYFDAEGLKSIVDYLQKPDAAVGTGVDVVRGTTSSPCIVTLRRKTYSRRWASCRRTASSISPARAVSEGWCSSADGSPWMALTRMPGTKPRSSSWMRCRGSWTSYRLRQVSWAEWTPPTR